MRMRDMILNNSHPNHPSEDKQHEAGLNGMGHADSDGSGDKPPNALSNKWDELGRKLVEARKCLDAATEADKSAGADLLAAQQKKAATLKHLQASTKLVRQLASEFTALQAGLVGLADSTDSNVPELNDCSNRPSEAASPALAIPFRISNEEYTSRALNVSSQSVNSGSSRPTGNDFEPLTSSSASKKRPRYSDSVPPVASNETPQNSKRTAVRDPESDGEDARPSSSSGRKKRNAYGVSSFRGVRKILATGQYEARISAGGKDIFLGRFDTEEEAARKYDDKARELHKEKAVLNFLTENDRAIGCKSAVDASSFRLTKLQVPTDTNKLKPITDG